jgi:hypothetical protein
VLTAGTLLVLLSLAWACPALAIRGPATTPRARRALAILWVLFALLAVVLAWAWRPGAGMGLYALGFAALLGWWFSLRPSHDRLWADEVSRMLEVERQGEAVLLRNVRDFDWHDAQNATPRWEERRYALDQLRSVDTALSYWMGPAIAHTLVCFGFADGRHLAFSIEIRKRRGDRFNAIGGFFRQFETCLVAAEERDILAVRTNARREDVYLYRVLMRPEDIRSLFLAYLETAETLRRKPRFYNTLTANCTTMVYEMARRIVHGLPLDRRLLLSGYLPEYLQSVQALVPGVDLPSLRAAGHINARAQAAAGETAKAFSARIRAGVPGYDADGRPLDLS